MPSSRRCSHASLLVSSAGMPRSFLMVAMSTGAVRADAFCRSAVVVIAALLGLEVAGAGQRLDDHALEQWPDVARELAVDEHLAFRRDVPARHPELQQALEDVGAQLVDLGVQRVDDQLGNLLVV